MDAFAEFESDLPLKFVLAMQGVLVIFFVVSPIMGKLIHYGIAKASSLVLIVCTMLLIGNVVPTFRGQRHAYTLFNSGQNKSNFYK